MTHVAWGRGQRRNWVHSTTLHKGRRERQRELGKVLHTAMCSVLIAPLVHNPSKGRKSKAVGFHMPRLQAIVQGISLAAQDGGGTR